MIAWNVRSETGWRHDRNGKVVRLFTDTVFFDDNCDADYVRRSLIDHDGYPADIVVQKEQTRGRTEKQA